MRLPTDTYTVTGVTYGYRMAGISDVSVVSGTTTTVNTPLAPANMYVVSGTVTDAAVGWPLYASIDVDGYPGDPIWSDPATGYYSISLAEGITYTFDVEAWVDGYEAASRDVGPLTGNETYDFGLDADLAACTVPGYTSSYTSIYSESFEGGFGDWTMTGLWNPENETDACGSLAAPFPSSSNGAYFGIDGTCTYDTGDTVSGTLTLVTPVALPAADSAILSFWSYEQTECDGDCHWDNRYVEISADGGGTWITPGEGDIENVWYQRTFDLTPYLGSDVLIRFRFDTVDGLTNDYFGWTVDDVSILTGTCAPQPGGLVVGNVYDEKTSDPLGGAEVTNEDGYLATAEATPDDPSVDAGFYTIFSPQGSKTFTATTTNYGMDADLVAVVQNDTVQQDFYLPSPHIELAPTALNYTLELGQQFTQTPGLVISNIGSSSLYFELQKQGGSFQSALAAHFPDTSSMIFEGTTGPISDWHPSDTPPEHSDNLDGTAPRTIAPLSWGIGTPIPSGAQSMGASVTTDDETFYLIGGYTGSYLNQNLHYNPATGTWDQSLASMPTARGNIFAYYNPYDGLIYVPGGYDSNYRNELEAYNPTNDSWTTLAPLPIAKSGANGGIVDGKLYLFGGNPAPNNETQIYDIASDTWTSGTPLPATHRYGANVTYEDYIYVIGGWQSAIFYRYDPATDTWQAGPSLNTARNSPAAAVSSDGIIYVWGGGDEWDALYDGEYYDLANWPSGSWTSITDDNLTHSNIRAGHVCASDLLWNEGGGIHSHDGNQYWDGLDCCFLSTDVPWLTENPITGTIAPDGSLDVDIGWWADVPEVDQPGDYYASLKIKHSDPAQQDLVLPATMTVTPPSTWGKLGGYRHRPGPLRRQHRHAGGGQRADRERQHSQPDDRRQRYLLYLARRRNLHRHRFPCRSRHRENSCDGLGANDHHPGF